MAPRKTLDIRMDVKGVRLALDRMKALPKVANDELRTASGLIAQDLAGAARSTAGSSGIPQTKLLGPTVKVLRDRVPAVQAGGTQLVGRNSVPAWKLLFGGEFGSQQYTQFQRRHTTDGYWLFPLIRSENNAIERRFLAAVDAIADSVTGA